VNVRVVSVALSANLYEECNLYR